MSKQKIDEVQDEAWVKLVPMRPVTFILVWFVLSLTTDSGVPVAMGTTLEGQEQEAADQADEPFEEERKVIELRTVWDFRFIRTDAPESWLQKGLGKMRYGGDNFSRASLFRIAQASFVIDTQPAPGLTTHFHLNLDLEPEFPEGRFGWDRLRIIELFGAWQTDLGESLEFRTKGGLFFPPVSLEHIGDAWTTVYTVTPSAINAWIGEEVRVTGAELALAHVGFENELSGRFSGFWNNDPTGSLLAYRGFALHDRQTGWRDRLPLPPIPAVEAGGQFEQQAPYVEPFRELDDRLGYYAGLAWENYRFFTLDGLYFDNRGDPAVFDGEQYAWNTRFLNVGGVVFLPAEIELLGQFMDGKTDMGFLQPGAPKVSADYRSWYALLTVPLGRQRLSLRYEKFRVRDRDEFADQLDNSDEQGSAWTFAYMLRVIKAHRLAVELQRAQSERPSRRSIGLLPEIAELQLQISFRLRF